jgi:hypothetical protein
MARSEHNREAYRALFGYVGAAIQAFAFLMLVISFPVAPVGVVAGLIAVGAVAALWSWRAYRTNFMAPTLVGVGIAVAWMLVVGLGAMLAGWGP